MPVDSSLRGNMQTTQISEAYFSRENRDHIQMMLQKCIYRNTAGHVMIPRQDDQDVVAFMSLIFDNHSRNLRFNIQGQLMALNEVTIRSLVSAVMPAVRAYLKAQEEFEKGPLAARGILLPRAESDRIFRGDTGHVGSSVF